MKVFLNSKPFEIEEGCTLARFLEDKGISFKGIAVACNASLIPKVQWESTFLKEGMELILVQAVSGG